MINGIQFLKETGGDAGAGHIHQWVAYSTVRDNTCVSLGFILHSLNPGNFPTPPPVFDLSAESAVFEQIIETFAWLTTFPTLTATPVPSQVPAATQTSTPVGSPAPIVTYTPTPGITPTHPGDDAGIVNGVVLAPKSVTITVSDVNSTSIRFVNANPDGTFGFSSLPGTYRLATLADGFLSAERTVTITAGNTSVVPTITLLAGDIDNNNVIDQFDAMTIGMSYNTSTPSAADLNNDGTINVLDLELLAKNYRRTGPVVWE